MFASLSVVLTTLATAMAMTRQTPPQGALVVGPGHGQYGNIQSAVNALSTSKKEEQVIFIYPGTYNEQVTIDHLKGPLTIYGYTNNTHSYASNQVTITAGHSQKDRPHNESTATLRAKIPNFKLYNVNVKNTYGVGSQALALAAYDINQGYYACSFTGFQDTVLSQIGPQVFSQSYIEGATDFVFGQYGQAYFDGCTIGVLPTPAGIGFVSASGRLSADSSSYYVFNNTSVAAAPGKNVPAGIYYLGRPWHSFARVVFQYCSLSNVINPKGWSVWNTANSNDQRIDHVQFGEFSNHGPGSATNQRASFSHVLSRAVTMTEVLGSGYSAAYYFDSSYFAKTT